MNTLRQAVHEYLEMRRNLGFKLFHAGKRLLDFVTFMEQHQAPTSPRRWLLPGHNSQRTHNRRLGPGA